MDEELLTRAKLTYECCPEFGVLMKVAEEDLGKGVTCSHCLALEAKSEQFE